MVGRGGGHLLVSGLWSDLPSPKAVFSTIGGGSTVATSAAELAAVSAAAAAAADIVAIEAR
jgi:hypothetical protein